MYLNFQAKGLLPDRTLESFIQTGQVKKLICSISYPVFVFFISIQFFPTQLSFRTILSELPQNAENSIPGFAGLSW